MTDFYLCFEDLLRLLSVVSRSTRRCSRNGYEWFGGKFWGCDVLTLPPSLMSNVKFLVSDGVVCNLNLNYYIRYYWYLAAT